MNIRRRRGRCNTSPLTSRRAVILAAAAWPALLLTSAVLGQSSKPPVLIGYVGFGSPEIGAPNVAAFKEGLAALGWKEGAQFVMDVRWAEGERERLPALIAELAKRKPAVIVTAASFVTGRVAKAAPSIPIVQASGADPVQEGLAKSHARPGGMVTGLTNIAADLSEKLIELLVDAAPKVKRVGALFYSGLKGNTQSRWLDPTRRSAARYAVDVHLASAAKVEEIEPAIADLAKQGAQALVVIGHPFLHSQRTRIIAAAQARRWPIISWTRVWVEEGALMSYGTDNVQPFRRAAYFVDRILKGAKPGDLPIELPMHFELAVNMKSAKALGLTIPPTILVRATHVIE